MIGDIRGRPNCFEPPAVLEPFIPAVEAVFRKWFEMSLEGLEQYLVREDRAASAASRR